MRVFFIPKRTKPLKEVKEQLKIFFLQKNFFESFHSSVFSRQSLEIWGIIVEYLSPF